MRNALGARVDRLTRPAPYGTCRGRARACGAIGVVLILLVAATALAGGPAAQSAAGGGTAGPGVPAPAPRDSLATPAHITARVLADTLHLTVDVPAGAMAAAGALLDRNTDGLLDAAELAASRDTLASYIEHHLFLLQDDGMLAPKLVGSLTTVPEGTRSMAAVRAAMRAPLLNTYERIGFASGILTDRIPGYRSLVTIEWGGARAEFDVAQSVQWVEPPAAGAAELELPGRRPGAGSAH